MPNVQFSAAALLAGLSQARPASRQERPLPDLFEKVDPDTRARYQDSLDLADRLDQGIKAAKDFAKTVDVESKKQRLAWLKLLAQTATDPRTIRAIAREVAEIARSLGAAGANTGGLDGLSPTLGQGMAAGGQGTAGANTAATNTATATAGAASAQGTETGADTKAIADQTTADPAGSLPSTAAGTSDSASLRQEVAELMKLAKKILEELRRKAMPGSREAQALDQAGQEVNIAAGAWGISLSADAGVNVAAMISVSTNLTTVDVNVEVSVDVRA